MICSRLAVVALLCNIAAAAQGLSTTESQIVGTVVDRQNGLPLRGVVAVVGAASSQTVSDDLGKLRFFPVPPGSYNLTFTKPGYRELSVPLDLSAGEDKTLEVSLDRLPAPRVDSINVEGDVIQPSVAAGSIDHLTLQGDNLKNLGTVLADDPFRAVQALPGVVSNDDFGARFFLRGADFNRIGIYIDGVQVHNALHTLQGTDLSGSASFFNMSLVRELQLDKSAYAQEFGNSSAGALSVQLRDGRTDQYTASLNVNLGTAALNASGPLGHWNRCSWIGGFRKSYIQYLLAQTLTDPSLAFGIQDEEGRLNCHVSEHNVLTLAVISGDTSLDRSGARQDMVPNSLLKVNQRSTFVNLSWLYSPTSRLQVALHAAWLPGSFEATAESLQSIGTGTYREKSLTGSVTWLASRHQTIAVGANTRAIGENGFTSTYDLVRATRQYNFYRASGFLSGAYLVDSWTTWHDRLRITGSARSDHLTVNGQTTVSPQAGLALRLVGSLQVQLAAGQYTQFPELSFLGSSLGSRSLLPARSNQFVAALSQSLPWGLHWKAEVYRRNDRDLLFQPTADARFLNGVGFLPPLNPLYANALRGTSRGLEFSLERSRLSGVNGWLSYAYGKTVMHDGVSNQSFPSNWDQRHSISAYGTYRLRPSVNLSSHWTWGSGLPAPGYFRLAGSQYYLSDIRNNVRLGSYQRLDVRVNKSWRGDKWHRALYLEVTNLTNHTNYRFGSLDGYNFSTGKAYVTVDSMFPILPAVGFVLER